MNLKIFWKGIILTDAKKSSHLAELHTITFLFFLKNNLQERSFLKIYILEGNYMKFQRKGRHSLKPRTLGFY